MTHKDAGHYADKHGPGELTEAGVKEAVACRAADGQLSCEAAFRIVEEFGTTPAEVGRVMDMLEIKLVHCQLGLFGYAEGKRLIVKPAESVPPDVEDALRNGLVNGRLPCAVAWEIARRFHMPKMKITAVCEKIGIRIKPCQMGSF